ncbi:MAG: transposase [Bacteroidales bacterium]|nr:transposase [Bacteroidales bacterium]
MPFFFVANFAKRRKLFAAICASKKSKLSASILYSLIHYKALVIYGWCLMPSHLHIICSVSSEIGMSGFLRDFKKFTSKQVVKLIVETP